MRHVQMEPVWGGTADSAGRLRSTCALALVQCRDVNSHRVLVHLVPLLADKEVPVQVNAARAIEQVGSDAAALLLRLRAELGSENPEILSACYAAVLALEGTSAIAWVAKFLPPADDAAGEAAMAIAQTHTPEAFHALRSTFAQTSDAWFRTVLLSAIALTRQPEATEWLLGLIAQDEHSAADAHEAICRSAPSEATLERLEELGKPCRGN
jgi:HEAT repeat protein